MKSTAQNIPEILIYEMDNGTPIYYRGYRDYLKGQSQLEQIMGSSYLQSLIISQIVGLLIQKLGKDFIILTNEVGLKLGKRSWLAADIAIYEKKQLKDIKLEDKLLEVAPKYVIEIDTKAATEEIKDSIGYYHKKTDKLIKFGVQEVVWIFTGSKKIMLANKKSKKWEIGDWDDMDITIETTKFNVSDFIPE